jgi:hypothetical protein
MTTPVYSNRKMAKIRFFATYAFSVLLLLVLFSSFLAPEPAPEEEVFSNQQEPADKGTAIYTMLHQQLEKLDAVCTKVAGNKSTENLVQLQAEEASFHTGMENIRIEVAAIRDTGRAKEMEKLIEIFSRTGARQIDLALGAAPTVAQNESSTDGDELKMILLQKEQRIAALEEQNRLLLENNEQSNTALSSGAGVQTPSTQREASSDAAEWKRKYERLKNDNHRLQENNNRIASQTNELKKSYKDVVEDNRRLLAQLQAARAGKN